MITKEIRVKEVGDLNYASVLIFKNFKLLDIKWQDRRKATWVFADNKGKADNVIRAYINDIMKGSIKQFVSAQNQIKQTLFNKS